MALVESSGALQIVKNGKPLSLIMAGYMTGSYRSNGTQSLYTVS